MKIVKFGTGQQFYHGSIRLYQARFYITLNHDLLENYLRDSQLSSDLTLLPSSLRDSFTVIYDQYKHPLPHIMVTKELLYIKTIKLLTPTTAHIAVSAIWKALLSSTDEDTQELLSFALEVEVGTEGSFDLKFISSMRLPVQFFTLNKECARAYASNNPYSVRSKDPYLGGDCRGAIYSYTLFRNISLLNYDDQTTRDMLTEKVYTSTTPFSVADIQYYTRCPDIHTLRRTILNLAISIKKSYKTSELLKLFDRLCVRKNTLERINCLTDDCFGEKWFLLYEKELLTPRNLWLLCMSFRKRFKDYTVDALLLKVLVEDNCFSGYVSAVDAELVIINPERCGVMDTDDYEL